MGRQEVMSPEFSPFNSAVETGLRCLAVLSEAYPAGYSLQRLVVFDYLLVHSDDAPGGPAGLHPQTPNRSGELLVRRETLHGGLMLYQSRGLVERLFRADGVYFIATDKSPSFLDVLDSSYAVDLRTRAEWVVEAFGKESDEQVAAFANEHIGTWGAEFENSAVLWMEKQ
ncbi:MAG: threonine transporter [Deltaproteobacteria bacterium]|nr:threonine transporter [Deltaproteobacteria bacterium]